MIFIYGTVLRNVFHVHTQTLVIVALESVKFLAFFYRRGKCIQQEDSNMVKVRPLLLIQQRRSNTSITHKDLTEGSFCHRHKMLLNNPHLIMKHRVLAYALHLAGAHGLKSCLTESMNCWINVSKAEASPRAHTLLSHPAAQKQGMRATEGMTWTSCKSAKC